MKSQSLFSGKNEKNIINLSSAELAHRMGMDNIPCISYTLYSENQEIGVKTRGVVGRGGYKIILGTSRHYL